MTVAAERSAAPRRKSALLENLGLVALSFAFLGLVEGVLRLGGMPADLYAPRDLGATPRKFFVPAPGVPGSVTVAPWLLEEKVAQVNASTFPAERPAGEMRIAVAGDSTSFGFPGGGSFAYAARLERILQQRFPGVHVRVINGAVAAWDAGRVANVVEEVVEYDPQVLIVYTGGNELLRRFAMEQIERLGARMRLRQKLAGLRTYQLLAWVWSPVARWRQDAAGGEEPAVVEAPPERSADNPRPRSRMRPVTPDQGVPGRGASAAPPAAPEPSPHHHPRTPEEDALVQALFRSHLTRMLRAAERAGVEVVLCTPASRLSFPPKRSVPESDAERAALQPYLAALQAPASPELREAIARAALQVAPRYAPLHFALASSLVLQGRVDEAEEPYVKARDLETSVSRATTVINGITKELGKLHGATVVDVEHLFRSRSDRGCFGEQLFIDQCHPDDEGQALIARTLADARDWAAVAAAAR